LLVAGWLAGSAETGTLRMRQPRAERGGRDRAHRNVSLVSLGGPSKPLWWATEAVWGYHKTAQQPRFQVDAVFQTIRSLDSRVKTVQRITSFRNHTLLLSNEPRLPFWHSASATKRDLILWMKHEWVQRGLSVSWTCQVGRGSECTQTI